MVQQTRDSKFCEYGLANTETGLPQLSVPGAAKKTVFQDLQNENVILLPESGPLLPDKSAPTGEPVKVSGAKRSSTECLMIPSQHQCPMSNTGNGHLVYVRRKPETELGRNSACDNQSYGINCSQLREIHNWDEAAEKKSPVKESGVSTLGILPISMPSSVGFSSARPSISPSLEKSCITFPPADLHPLHDNPMPSNLLQMHTKHREERYWRLQNFLRNLDQSDQNDYIQMLQSLSSVELSKHAVELEKRSIQLSLEEGKELQRVQVLDVLEKYSKHSRGSLTHQNLLLK